MVRSIVLRVFDPTLELKELNSILNFEHWQLELYLVIIKRSIIMELNRSGKTGFQYKYQIIFSYQIHRSLLRYDLKKTSS